MTTTTVDTEELRGIADDIHAMVSSQYFPYLQNVIRQAAEEIDRLRADYSADHESYEKNILALRLSQNLFVKERDQARAECERLRKDLEDEQLIRCSAEKEALQLHFHLARAVGCLKLVDSLLAEDGVKEHLACYSVFHILRDRLRGSSLAEPTDRLCHHTQAPCDSPAACDAQQACHLGPTRTPTKTSQP